MNEHDEPVPDLDELYQDEPAAAVLDVDVKGPVRTQALPARTAVIHSAVVGTDPVQLCGEDKRRSRALVWAIADATAPYFLGTRRDEVQQETCGQLLAVADDGTAGAVHQVELLTCEPLYAMASTGTVTVSYVLEQWAD